MQRKSAHLLLVVLFLTAVPLLSAAPCTVFLGNTPLSASSYAIAKPTQATPSEENACLELQKYLEKITGEKLQIVQENALGTLAPIYVGKCTASTDVDWTKLGPDGIHLELRGNALILAGGSRGVLYAVYSFLEENLGYRWYTPDCHKVPSDQTIKITDLNKTYIPALEYRDTDYPVSKDDFCRPTQRFNGLYGSADPKWGGRYMYYGFVHTFDQLVPPSKYANQHPEYYSLIDGKRDSNNSQLCLTNSEVLSIAIESVRKAMREHPEATIFSVSQNDNQRYCQCPECTKLAEKEGSQAGPLLHFVNAIAQSIQKEFPDKLIDTLAYQYTRKPPKFVKPQPNVIVRLCSIECCFLHPIEECPRNQSFIADMTAWSKLTKRLHIWDYVINYCHCLAPFPNFGVLKSNIQFFIAHSATGIYEEANYFSKGGELSELRTYVLSKLLWNPDSDPEALMNEFIEAYYGPAAQSIKDYIKLSHKVMLDQPDRHIGIFADMPALYNIPEFLSEANRLFDEAQKATATQPDIFRRVRLARLPIIYVQIVLNERQSAEAMKTEANARLLREFIEIIDKEGITHRCEGPGNLRQWAQERLEKSQK